MNEKYFIIWYNENFDDIELGKWEIGSCLYDSYEEALKVYNEAKKKMSCYICRTIVSISLREGVRE